MHQEKWGGRGGEGGDIYLLQGETCPFVTSLLTKLGNCVQGLEVTEYMALIKATGPNTLVQ